MNKRVKAYFLVYVLLLPLALSPAPAKTTPQRCSSIPSISGDSFRALADHVFDETDTVLNSADIQEKDVVFVKTDYLEHFFTQTHPTIAHRYILITHNSDGAAPGLFEPYLDDQKIIVWFGQNPTIQHHAKFIPIPIGIANQCWRHGNTDTFNHVLQQTSLAKKYLLGLNFIPSTCRDVRDWVFAFFINKQFCSDLRTTNHYEYLFRMKEAKFILSPRGNGLDCHRTWEALLMGCIPVLQTSELDELVADLPVLIIDDWEKITEQFLEVEYAKITNGEKQLEKIYFDYWSKLVRKYKNGE